jgi:hypothetical protein
MTRILLLAVVALVPVAADAAARCPAARYLVVQGALVPEAGGREVIVVGDGTVAVEDACPPVHARLRGRRTATRVRAAWRAATACTGLPARAVLQARITDGCMDLAGTLVARRATPRTRTVVARRSVCGDGVADAGADEACDQDDSAACPGACRADCTCGGTTTTPLPAGGPTGLYGVTDAGLLIHFAADAPATVSAVAVIGLDAGEELAGIDFRPATGELYALAVTGSPAADALRLYRVDVATGAAVPVGAPVTGIDHGAEYGFAFNAVADRIRVVNDADDNLRLDPATGARVDAPADTNLHPQGRLIRGLAYDGAASPVLFGLCFASSELVRIGVPSPNDGTIIGVGGFGFATAAGSSGFDVDPQSGTAFATLRALATGLTGLYRVDLGAGTATLVGPVGDGTQPVPGLAVGPGGAGSP